MTQHTPTNNMGCANSRAPQRGRAVSLATVAVLISALTTGPARAAGGDFANTDFAAAAPFTYNHDTGGGAYNDRTVGDYKDITEQLEGAQFSCGDIVTYLMQIQLEGTTVDPVQTAEYDFRFLGNSTGQRGAAHVEVVGVSVNYGSVENGDSGTGGNPGAGLFGVDSGIIDDGGSTATLMSQTLVGTLFQSGGELLATVRVDDLEPGESVVVRIDTRLACDPGTSPTGNLQGQLDAGRVVYNDGSNDVINTGQQTIPFLRVGDIAGAGEPLLKIQKTVTTAAGTCGVDDGELENVLEGETVKYCYSVYNPGTAALYDVEVIDDNGTNGDTTDDFTVNLVGLGDLDNDGDLGDLASGETVYGEAFVTFAASGTVINTAVATGNNGLSGGNFRELSDSDTAEVQVEEILYPPVANDDATSTGEGAEVTINVVYNDTDQDNNLDPTTANTDCAECSLPQNGSLVNNADGTFTYTPNAGFEGEDTFVYEICDTDGQCDTAQVTVAVATLNSPPVPLNDVATVSEDDSVTIDVLVNDSDPDGDVITTTGVTTAPANGTATVNPDGTITYTPAPDYVGTDTFSYEICDPSGECATATVIVTVVGVNDPPVAEDDTATTSEDSPITIDILDNDSDIDGNLDIGSVQITSHPTHGAVETHADGTVTYTPDAQYNGADSFIYEVCDTDGLCDTATVAITVDPVNDAPAAADDSYSTAEDTALTIDAPGILGNDSDVDGDTLTANLLTSPSSGTLTQNADGSFTYTPNENFSGTDSYTYEACDGSGACAQATVTIVVTPVNDAPAAADDSYSTAEDTALTIDAPGVLGNDSDADGETLTVNLLTSPSNGSLTQNADGSFTYTPNQNFTGTDSYTYEACDGSGVCDTATVTLNVTPVNDVPVAADDSYSTAEDTPLVVAGPGILANDTDADGDTLTVNLLSNPNHGTLTQNADGSFVYMPYPNFSGTDSYTYEACDGSGACAQATVVIVVTPVNDPPEAFDDSAAVDEDSSVDISVLGNDSDIDGNLDPTSVSIVGAPEHGDTTVNPDGTVTYTPDANYNGSDEFAYEVCDDAGSCDTATVTIDVQPVNDPPNAVNDYPETDEEVPVTFDVAVNDTDIDANLDPSTANTDCGSCSLPQNGSLVNNGDGTFTYTPNANFHGTDNFTYQICDADGLCDTATVTISVAALNDPPVAVDDSASTNEDTAVLISASANDSDVDGNLDLASAEVVSGPSNGTVTDNGDGTFTYTPDANFNGTDSFGYQICDTGEPPAGGTPLCDTATVTITVLAVNDPPVALDDGASTNEDTPVTVIASNNDSDVDGNLDVTTATSITNPTNGSVTDNGDGSFTYEPYADFFGVDSFDYQICDTDSQCDTATVTITVLAVNDPPVANNDSASTNEDTPVLVDVADNDWDVDDNLDLGSATVLEGPQNGSVVNNGDGTFTYTPDANYNGTDSFTYEICDLELVCDTATVTITVVAVNDPPVASDDWASTNEDTAVTIPVTGNDTDVDGNLDASSASVISGPSNGTVSSDGAGSLIYTPNADFYGTDSFQYKVCDTDGLCDDATVSITVIAVNDPPVAADDAVTTNEDTVVSFNVTGNDSDVEGELDLTSVEVISGPTHGTLSGANGNFTYTPDADYSGPDSFSYQICDADGLCDTAAVNITVLPVNDPPSARDDSYITQQDTTLTVAADGILGNDTDVDGDAIYVDAYDVTSAYGGTVAANADGSFSYTPAPGFAGYDTFTYTISDGHGGTATATVTIEVQARNNRSISVSWADWTLSDGSWLGGEFSITNQSGGYSVQITDLRVDAQYRLPGQRWTDVAVSGCIYDPSPSFEVTTSRSVTFDGCELAEPIPADATLRVTANVHIYGRIKGKGKAGGWFLSRLSK